MVTGWVVALVIMGLGFLFLEIFLPGGILGIAGIILLSAGIFMTAESALAGVAYVCTFLLILGLLIALSFRFPRTRKFWENFSLKDKQSSGEGYLAPSVDLEKFVGSEGIALSPLRPAGTGDFSGTRLDVVTEGSFIEKDSPIRVIAVEGTRVVVREINK